MEDLKWISAMADRLKETNMNEMDEETKDKIIQAFMNGLFKNPGLIEDLKSSSLIESDYFEDEE